MSVMCPGVSDAVSVLVGNTSANVWQLTVFTHQSTDSKVWWLGTVITTL